MTQSNPSSVTVEQVDREAAQVIMDKSRYNIWPADAKENIAYGLAEQRHRLSAAQPAREEILPCDVKVPPATVIGAGCSMDTLRLALSVEGRPRHFASPAKRDEGVRNGLADQVGTPGRVVIGDGDPLYKALRPNPETIAAIEKDEAANAAGLAAIRDMVVGHVENWPEPKKFGTAISLLDKMLHAALTPANGDAMRVAREALIASREKFLFYEQSHLAKETSEADAKARVNADMAAMIASALVTLTKGADDVG